MLRVGLLRLRQVVQGLVAVEGRVAVGARLKHLAAALDAERPLAAPARYSQLGLTLGLLHAALAGALEVVAVQHLAPLRDAVGHGDVAEAHLLPRLDVAEGPDDAGRPRRVGERVGAARVVEERRGREQCDAPGFPRALHGVVREDPDQLPVPLAAGDEREAHDVPLEPLLVLGFGADLVGHRHVRVLVAHHVGRRVLGPRGYADGAHGGVEEQHVPLPDRPRRPVAPALLRGADHLQPPPDDLRVRAARQLGIQRRGQLRRHARLGLRRLPGLVEAPFVDHGHDLLHPPRLHFRRLQVGGEHDHVPPLGEEALPALLLLVPVRDLHDLPVELRELGEVAEDGARAGAQPFGLLPAGICAGRRGVHGHLEVRRSRGGSVHRPT
mmetsp:Transcript_103149/g.292211  ORF Transcript_103149/g.292211 Transcript_103149/m.292211 type:complete len:383 (+) Transcript_103149:541-1689(+)